MSPQSDFSGFPPETIQFYADLLQHNERPWFEAHKADYQKYVLEPGKLFVMALGERLKTISAEIQFDTRTNGSGSIMRIYRDVRFSKDKTPYKTYLGIIFWEGSGKKTESPGFHFGMDATGAQMHVGIWGFPKPMLMAYREAVADEKLGSELEGILTAVSQNPIPYTIGGQHYKRVPRGYPKDHPRADLLRYNGLHASSPAITPEQISSPELLDICFTHAKNLAPLQQWLVKVAK